MAENTDQALKVHSAEELAAYLRECPGSDHPASTVLHTDERVLARVTDGIYRQPASALRELIINAYDADATRVVVKTDAPRFSRIEVSDNGNGMTPDVLAHLLFHIGGSAKRHQGGRALGITSEKSPLYSPGGRRLIGKIGIGLFSVSQLTRSFQIVTKTKGDRFRTIATIALKQYSDDSEAVEDAAGHHKYESGKVNIWRERASDESTHGTTIVLNQIRPQAQDTLRSREIWEAIDRSVDKEAASEESSIRPPRYHIGRVNETGNLIKGADGPLTSLPWDPDDAPRQAFLKLVQSVWDEIGKSTPNPRLDQVFDYYLRMVWQLALALPVPYVNGHLFDETLHGWARGFSLSNSPKGQPSEIELRSDRSVRDIVGLTEPSEPDFGFEVIFDNFSLKRPILYKNLPATHHALKHPLVFFGTCREEFSRVPRELSGGPLEFEAYLFWTPKVAPVEHQGALVRIHGASGTLFDSTFMRYQVSEQTRLRQITCEIFVKEGLDSALNIDRESFNTAHPHSVFITKWLHAALRQLANTQKRVAKEVRDSKQADANKTALTDIQKVALATWRQFVDENSEPPEVKFSLDLEKDAGPDDVIAYHRRLIIGDDGVGLGSAQRAKKHVVEEKLKAITQVLSAFGLLDQISSRQQEQLLKAIFEILEAD